MLLWQRHQEFEGITAAQHFSWQNNYLLVIHTRVNYSGRNPLTIDRKETMGPESNALDEQIERLRGGDTLTENEVRALCEKVRHLLIAAAMFVCVVPQPNILQEDLAWRETRL